MPTNDARIDAYIAKSAGFAKPVLKRLRKLVHSACPKVEETIKWNSPFYEHNGILLCTPAFKKHCALIFWKGKLFLGEDREKLRRITSANDLPGDKVLLGYIRKAVELNEAGIKNPARTKPAKKEIVVPEYFLAALTKNKKAQTAFQNFSPSHQREYVQWIIEARRDETRVQRVQSAVQQIATGKSKNSKYQNKK